jgi:pimeloyl-ACP methyl ester carboxylesterase
LLNALLLPIAIGLSIGGIAAATAQSAATGDFDGGVDVDGRKIHLECKGAGAPTVILISGYRNSAEIWTVKPGPGLTPVFAAVAQFTRTCAYDRPGTIVDADHLSRSERVPMPRTTEAIATELHAMLESAGIKGPYVLAAHSLGGLFARLYTATYPEDVAGMVLIDAWQEDLEALLGPAQWAAYVDLATPPPPGLDSYADLEFVDFKAASAGMREALKSGPLRPMPLYVISRGKPVQLPPDVPVAFSPNAFEAAWREGQRRLAALRPDARHQIAAESDHYIQIEQPVLVVEAIRGVYDAVRDPASWTSNDQVQPSKTTSALAAPKTDVRPAAPGSAEFAGLIDIGGGRKMYLECRGTGSPTVVLVAGLKASAADWNSAEAAAPTVFSGVANVTRVCAYDRPGTPVGEQPSRSDPVRQPTTAADAIGDLHALLVAAHEPAPYVLVGHSYGGLIAKLYARTYPHDAAGLVLVDALSEGLQEAETPKQWAMQRILMEGDTEKSRALYWALERIDPDRSFDQVRAEPPLNPLPLIVLSADRPWGPQIPALIAEGTLPADVPADFGYITDAAQKEAQDRLAVLVPGARHITNTHSGHEIHKEQPGLVTDAIIDVVDAVRAGKTSFAQ